MTSIIFDPDAHTEFLKAVRHYEGSQHGLGLRFRLAVEAATQKISEYPFYTAQ